MPVAIASVTALPCFGLQGARVAQLRRVAVRAASSVESVVGRDVLADAVEGTQPRES
jgi:hypothetical protein